jgi:hypothetical protein
MGLSGKGVIRQWGYPAMGVIRQWVLSGNGCYRETELLGNHSYPTVGVIRLSELKDSSAELTEPNRTV